MVTVLDPDRPWSTSRRCDAVVHGPVFATKRAPHSPLAGLRPATLPTAPAATWRIGMVHGSIAIPGKTDRDEVVITTDEIAAQRSRLPRARPLALGAGRQAPARSPTPTPARPRRSPSTRTGPARSSSSSSTSAPASGTVTVEERQVGRTEFDQDRARRRDRRASQPALVDALAARADPDLVLDVAPRRRPPRRARPRTSTRSRPRSRRRSSRSASATRRVPALTEGPLPSPDTIAGAFIRDLEARIARAARRPARPPRPPSTATRSGSAACCSPATRSRCEDPPAPAAATSGATAPSTSSSRPA